MNASNDTMHPDQPTLIALPADLSDEAAAALLEWLLEAARLVEAHYAGGQVVGDRGPRGADEGHGPTARLGEPEGEEGGGALVQMDPGAQGLAARGAHGEGSRARTR